MNLQKWLKGKKTYIVSALTIAGSIAVYCGAAIPPYVWPIAAALGLVSLRAGVEKMADGMQR